MDFVMDDSKTECPSDYYADVRAVAGRYAKGRDTTADDLTQSAMLVLVTRWATFDLQLSSRRSWVANVAQWAMIDAMRDGTASTRLVMSSRQAVARGDEKREFELVTVGGEDRITAPNTDRPDDADDFLGDFRCRVGRTLRGNERAIAVLYFVEGLQQREIALVLEITESRVSQIMSKMLDDCREKAGVVGYRPRIDCARLTMRGAA